MTTTSSDTIISGRLRAVLLDLARREDELAADERAGAPYWASCPLSALGHRNAANVLRAEADLLLASR
ncbi:hypothetical protein GCM10009798_05040 [Nocardioides panacihumi]|uniref:DUF222 domain-containing protein n=1 Tax=Nocardioides panacihumi TaxID=400774 RepID=A0ABP5BPU1_9ACTN